MNKRLDQERVEWASTRFSLLFLFFKFHTLDDLEVLDISNILQIPIEQMIKHFTSQKMKFTIKSAEATCVKTVMKKCFTETNIQFQCSIKFSAHINMFQQHYLGNKKLTFLACNTQQVYAAILKSSKINDLFRNRQIYCRRIFEISRNFLDMVSIRLQT